MKNSTLLSLILSILIIESAHAQKLHTLDFKSTQDMYSFFSYEKDKRIISGHRGSKEKSLPENSIIAMKEVLKHTLAIFEIDPRLSRDSVAIVIHDATLDRTTTGRGYVRDYTWKELKKLNLKNDQGEVTKYKINTLEEMIKWAKGKTILNLDKKDLPLDLTADIIKKHNAYAWVWVTVHNIDQARYYLDRDSRQFLSMHIKSIEALQELINSGLPLNRMIVYVGTTMKESNVELFSILNKKGVMCMISTAPTYDKLSSEEERAQKYIEVFDHGANILETDLPIEVSKAIR